MASMHDSIEYCEECGTETPHLVHVEFITESDKQHERAKYSREPYRVAKCMGCDTETKDRACLF